MGNVQSYQLCTCPLSNRWIAMDKIVSPLTRHCSTWQLMLADYPDSQFRGYICEGLPTGFRIGFDYNRHSCKAVGSNHLSVMKNPRVVQEYIANECAEGRLIGPLHSLLHPQVHSSPFGVFPKSEPGKWHLILDLSFPEETSVNAGISKELSTLAYVSLDEVVDTILTLGAGCLLTKIDIRSAYRLIPVHPQDRYLLGMKWQGALYVDCVLPFGLRSAPKIFNAVADALQWILCRQGIDHIFHYLDDYLCVQPPPKTEAFIPDSLHIMVEVCKDLGVPLAMDKVEGPKSCLTFLGIEIDTDQLQMRLPVKKLKKVKEEVQYWLCRRKACKKRELQSLCGLLQHACKVVRPGRIFLRRLIETMESARHSDHWVRLNSSFRSDLLWWDAFLSEWNRVAMLWAKSIANLRFRMTSDASGNWGCGAIAGVQWFQLEWSSEFREAPIHVKELVPIVIGAFVWGHHWAHEVMQFECDNMAVVEVLNKGYSRDTSLMHLMHTLFFAAPKYNFWFVASHLPGARSVAADAISRDNLSVLFAHAPDINHTPSFIPQAVLKTLVSSNNWTSSDWVKQFRSCWTTQ